MTVKPKPPADFDDNRPLDADFFANARPATAEAELVRRAFANQTAEQARYRAVLAHLAQAHKDGIPMREALASAQAMVAAE